MVENDETPKKEDKTKSTPKEIKPTSKELVKKETVESIENIEVKPKKRRRRKKK